MKEDVVRMFVVRSGFLHDGGALQKHVVERVRGGEWLNHARVFNGSKFYSAYLCASAGFSMPVRLDQVAAVPVIGPAVSRFLCTAAVAKDVWGQSLLRAVRA